MKGLMWLGWFLAASAAPLPDSDRRDALTGLGPASRDASAPIATPAALEFFVVNTSDDVDDGSCDLAHCSLREAIHAANASPGPDDIEIVQNVVPLSPLPHIVDPVNIFGSAVIGSAAGPTDGLTLADGSGSSIIQFVDIRGFEGSGIRILSDDNFVLLLTISDNGSNGITIDGGANNTIGFATLPVTLAGNGGSGVAVVGHQATGNTVQVNIFQQNAFGIDVASPGPEPNDVADVDTGANRRQNFPVITAYDPLGLTPTTVTLDSLPQTAFEIDFYTAPACHPSTYGEGAHLTTVSATTDAGGHAEVNLLLTSANPALTATATDPDGNTSEFSRCFCNGPDGDSDDRPDCSDCAPFDRTVHGPPLRVQNLRSDGISMIWDSDAPNSGSGTEYDVVRGALSDLPVGAPGADEICLGTTSDAQLLLGQDPPPGTGYFFVVRGKNSCGASGYGTDSFENPRVTNACPP